MVVVRPLDAWCYLLKVSSDAHLKLDRVESITLCGFVQWTEQFYELFFRTGARSLILYMVGAADRTFARIADGRR